MSSASRSEASKACVVALAAAIILHSPSSRAGSAVLIEVSPVAVPTGAPFVGGEGVDAFGYPRKSPDRAAILQTARARKFDALTKWIEEWQTAFEGDFHKEYWPIDALDAFAVADPRLSPVLEAWAAANPTSFAPYAAKGVHAAAMGWAWRGGGWARDTSAAQFEDMADAHREAAKNLVRALQLRPGLVAAHRMLIKLAPDGNAGPLSRAALAAALAVCPDCFQVRVAFLYDLTPRWGGSYEKMRAFTAEAAPRLPTNPKLAALAGFADVDRCDGLLREKKMKEALAACSRAIASGDQADFLSKRARVEAQLERRDDALRDVERALVLRPQSPNMIQQRVRLLLQRERWEEAGRDALTALRIDPFSIDRDQYNLAVRGLVWQAQRYQDTSQTPAALRVFDLALALSPRDPEARGRRFAVLRKRGFNDVQVAALEARAEREPESFEAVRDLDDALAHRGRFDAVIKAWTRYLAARPDDAQAWFERAGAHHHRGEPAEARRDAAKACQLGLKEACKPR